MGKADEATKEAIYVSRIIKVNDFQVHVLLELFLLPTLLMERIT